MEEYEYSYSSNHFSVRIQYVASLISDLKIYSFYCLGVTRTSRFIKVANSESLSFLNYLVSIRMLLLENVFG